MKLLNKYWDILLVISISFIPLLTLLNPGLPITHDGQDHVARIANFYLSLSEGNIVPRWGENLNWGYGHPVLMFLYPLPSYFASAFHFIGFSLVDSVKLVFGLSYIASGIFMYLWARNFLGNIPGLVATILYLYAPYRFVDLYVRGAIGEHVAFIFPPLILYFILKLSKKYSYWYFLGISFSVAGLLLSHNALAIMFLPFIIFYALYLIWNAKDKKILSLIYLAASVLGFGLSAFFLVPAFMEGKYTLRDIVTGSEALSRFVNFSDLIYGPWSFGGTGSFTVQLGIINWIFVLLTPFGIWLLYKQKKSIAFYIFVLIYLAGSIFIMLDTARFIWELITTLQKFQFPWRFLSVSVFAAATLGGLFVYSIKDRRLKSALLVLVIIFSLLLTKDYWYAKGYLQKEESFYTGIYESTTDTGESAPIWSVRFMEEVPPAPMEVIEGEAEIRMLERTSTYHSYEINSSHSSRIRENTVYFPGWKVYVNGKEYQGVQFQDPAHRGLITFKVLDGANLVEIIFEDTRLRNISDMISGLSFFILLLFYLRNSIFKKKNAK